MKRLTFLLGILIGWLSSAVIAPPRWLRNQVAKIYQTGHEKIEEKKQGVRREIQDQLQGIQNSMAQELRKKTEGTAMDIEKQIERQ